MSGKKMDPDVKQLRVMWRAFMRMSEDARRPSLRWISERYSADEAAKKRAAAVLFASPLQLVEPAPCEE